MLAGACMAILFFGRWLLAPGDRDRLRLPIFALAVYLVLWPVRAELLSLDQQDLYFGARIGATICLWLGVIGAAGFVTFDLFGRRFGVAKLYRDVTVTIACVLAFTTVLGRAGVNALSILTTSAILTAVIGLALQDTIGNLMAGITLSLESSFNIGDWIRLDDKTVGRVVEMRWRSTVLKTKNSDLLVVPNSALTKGVITTFNQDGLENRRWVYFHVHLRHPPNVVEATVMAALTEVPNVSAQTPPDCILYGIEDGVHRFAVRYRLIDFLPDDPTDSAVRKRIWYALSRAHIEMAWPGRNLQMLPATRAHRRRRHRRELTEEERIHRRAALSKVDFFKPIADADRERIISGMRHRLYAKGETIVRAGAEGHDLYIICAGDAEVTVSLDHLKEQVATLTAGQFFGEMSLMTGAPRRATVTAKTDVDCYVFDRHLFLDVLQCNPDVGREVTHLFADREADLDAKRHGLTIEAAKARSEHIEFRRRLLSMLGLLADASARSGLRQRGRPAARARSRHLRWRHLFFLLGGVQVQVRRPTNARLCAGRGAARATKKSGRDHIRAGRDNGDRVQRRRACAGERSLRKPSAFDATPLPTPIGAVELGASSTTRRPSVRRAPVCLGATSSRRWWSARSSCWC